MKNTTQTTTSAPLLFVLILLVCLGWPSLNDSWGVIAMFAAAKGILGGLIIWESFKLVRARSDLPRTATVKPVSRHGLVR